LDGDDEALQEEASGTPLPQDLSDSPPNLLNQLVKVKGSYYADIAEKL